VPDRADHDHHQSSDAEQGEDDLPVVEIEQLLDRNAGAEERQTGAEE
jgi:hypothetical protein